MWETCEQQRVDVHGRAWKCKGDNIRLEDDQSHKYQEKLMRNMEELKY